MMCRVTSSKGIVIGASETIAVALFARIAGAYKRLALVATAGKATTKAVITKSAVLIIDAARDVRFMAGLSFSGRSMRGNLEGYLTFWLGSWFQNEGFVRISGRQIWSAMAKRSGDTALDSPIAVLNSFWVA